ASPTSSWKPGRGPCWRRSHCSCSSSSSSRSARKACSRSRAGWPMYETPVSSARRMNAALPPQVAAGFTPSLIAPRRPLLTRGGWAMFTVVAYGLLVLVPSLNLLLPAGHPLHLSDYFVTLVGKVMCYAIVALAMDLIWGYAGILSLGHGLFFALGGYAMGMYLMRSIGREGVYHSDLPDFMVFLDWTQLPWYWAGSDRFWQACLFVVLVPGVLALVFGWFAFRSRIRCD